MGKHRRKEKIQQKDSKPAHITGTMTVFEYVHELLAGECSLGCGCTCFFANVHNLSNKTKFCWLMKQKWASVKMIEHHVKQKAITFPTIMSHFSNMVVILLWLPLPAELWPRNILMIPLFWKIPFFFSPYLCHGFKRFSYFYFWRRQSA